MSIVSTDRYRIIREQQSDDKGQTWVDTGNIYYSDVEKNSEYCGYIPSADFKATLYYNKYHSGDTIFTYDVPWNRSTVISNSEITGTTSIYYLRKIVLNEGLTAIDRFTFSSQGNTNNLEVIAPDSLRFIGADAFNATDLKETSVLFTPNLEEIGYGAFQTCDFGNNVNIIFPDSLTFVGNDAFAYSRFNKLTYGSGLSAATDFKGSYVKEVVFPEAIKTIGSDAFSGCTGLTSITFEGSSIRLLQNAFYGCSSLSTIRTYASIDEIYQNSLGNIASRGTLYYSQNVNVNSWISALPSGWTTTLIPS